MKSMLVFDHDNKFVYTTDPKYVENIYTGEKVTYENRDYRVDYIFINESGDKIIMLKGCMNERKS